MTEDEIFLMGTLDLVLRALIDPDEHPRLTDGLGEEVIVTLTDALARRPTEIGRAHV